MKNLKFTIITFYQFKKNSNIDNFQQNLRDFCLFQKIKGSIILAKEGIKLLASSGSLIVTGYLPYGAN